MNQKLYSDNKTRSYVYTKVSILSLYVCLIYNYLSSYPIIFSKRFLMYKIFLCITIYLIIQIGENQCYNSMCPAGIIMVSSDIALGLDLGPPCVRGSRTMVSSEFGLLKVCWLSVSSFLFYDIIIKK